MSDSEDPNLKYKVEQSVIEARLCTNSPTAIFVSRSRVVPAEINSNNLFRTRISSSLSFNISLNYDRLRLATCESGRHDIQCGAMLSFP